MSIPVHILPLALALAGAAGLRAFLPLFYVCLAVHLGFFSPTQLNPHLPEFVDLVHSSSTLTVLGALMAIEIVVEMVPRLSAMLDVPFLLVRIIAAMAVAFAVNPMRDFSNAFTVSIVVGFIGAISIINLQVRNGASELERLPAYVHFASSLLLDGICLAVVSLSLQLPYVGLAILYPGTWVGTLMLHGWRRSLERKVQVAALGPAPEMPDEFLRRSSRPGGAN